MGSALLCHSEGTHLEYSRVGYGGKRASNILARGYIIVQWKLTISQQLSYFFKLNKNRLSKFLMTHGERLIIFRKGRSPSLTGVPFLSEILKWCSSLPDLTIFFL